MEPVSFDEQPALPQTARKVGFITKLVITSGLAKDEQGANVVLIALSLVILAITAFVIWNGMPSSAQVIPVSAQ